MSDNAGNEQACFRILYAILHVQCYTKQINTTELNRLYRTSYTLTTHAHTDACRRYSLSTVMCMPFRQTIGYTLQRSYAIQYRRLPSTVYPTCLWPYRIYPMCTFVCVCVLMYIESFFGGAFALHLNENSSQNACTVHIPYTRTATIKLNRLQDTIHITSSLSWHVCVTHFSVGRWWRMHTTRGTNFR